MTKPSAATPCSDCGYVHTSRDALVVGSRFVPQGPRTYRAAHASAPARATRDAAVADECAWRVSEKVPLVVKAAVSLNPPSSKPILHNSSEARPFPAELMETAARAKAWSDFTAQVRLSLLVAEIDDAGDIEPVVVWLRRCREDLARWAGGEA